MQRQQAVVCSCDVGGPAGSVVAGACTVQCVSGLLQDSDARHLQCTHACQDLVSELGGALRVGTKGVRDMFGT